MKRVPLKRQTPLRADTGLGRTKFPKIAKDRFATVEMKRRVFGKDQGVCYLCADDAAYDDGVAEHVLAKGRGGQTEIDNLRWAHRTCNKLKGSMSIEKFRELYGGA